MLKELFPAARATIVLAVFTGLIFPLAMTAVGQLVFPFQANGSLIRDAGGKIIGSQLIGQAFTRPEYFHPRPSAAGSGYEGEASGGANLGPTSKKLLFGDADFPGIKQLAEAYRKENSLPADAKVPVDAVTRSASGLDPHITVVNALYQAPRVAGARHLSQETVIELVKSNTQARELGFLGEPCVNVLALNLALDKLKQ